MNQLEQELKKQARPGESLLSIGVFDGVHLGHQHLLSQLQSQAKQARAWAGVVTFQQHPRRLLSPNSPTPCLTPLPEKLRQLQELGLEVVLLSFTPELAQMEAEDFLRLLQKFLGMRGLVVGPDFALGRDRMGDLSTLQRLKQRLGFSLQIVPSMILAGEVVSSTAIRRALGRGEVERVRRFLGHPYSVTGKIVEGAERGRGLGFPTANLDPDPQQALPADGVYATLACLSPFPLSSVTNIGLRPTFGKGERTVETHLLDYKEDLYGQVLRIEFVARLRGERKFPSPQELKQQIEQDTRRAREILQDELQARTR